MTEHQKTFILFAAMWLALFTFQAWWTPPHIDEVYYWRFSQFLDWGYFDHPPMVALMIYVSDLLFDHSSGIRALTVITTLATIWIVYKTVDQPEKVKTFWALTFTLPLLHLYGFITTPDVPLLFFGALYFYFYKRITEHHKWTDYLFWGLIMGLILYSKYHGALLIILTLISNPKLFLKPQTYVAGGIGLLIWAPHVLWQYEHNWMTFRYHLSERVGIYKWFYPLEYLGNLLVVFNPFFIVVLYKTIRNKWKTLFEKTMYFTLVGFLVFFALQSFRDHVQPQWLVLTYLPLIYLVITQATEKRERNIRRLALYSSPLLIALHVFMTWDLLGTDGGLWRKEQFVEQVESEAKGKPVVFFDSYKEPSIYEFYRPESTSHSFNRAPKRKNQFNIWLRDTMMNDQEVYVHAEKKHKMPKFTNYRSFDKLKVLMDQDSTLSIYNPYPYSFNIDTSELQLNLLLYSNKRVVKNIPLKTLTHTKILPEQNTSLGIKVNIPDQPEADAFGYSVRMRPWPAAAVYHRYKTDR